jgi:glycosyltransferase involved in cell wall biosynthesis
VDNNSSDRTKEVVESYKARGFENLRYAFEPKQGVSYGRNKGILDSRAEIIAFTDDDVRASPDWVVNIKRALDEHPEADFVGGKILPQWEGEPPPWLTRAHWWPLSLIDFGDEPFYVNVNRPICLPTANAAFRRGVFNAIGLFSPSFSGKEDYELLVRLWRGGRQGIYVPEILVTTVVQAERLKKEYHHKWNLETGRYNSLMRLNEIIDAEGRLVGELPDIVTFLGTPGYLYRSLISESFRWVLAALKRNHSASQQHKNHVWYLIGYIKTGYGRYVQQRKHSTMREVVGFTRAILKKKFRKQDG